MEGLNLELLGIINEQRKRQSILTPILVKLVIFTAMITLAMVLFYSGMEWAGIAIYAKEVFEFALFIFYLVRRKRR